jgi:hypothetical protein
MTVIRDDPRLEDGDEDEGSECSLGFSLLISVQSSEMEWSVRDESPEPPEARQSEDVFCFAVADFR